LPSNFNTDNTTSIETQVLHKQAAAMDIAKSVDKDAEKNEFEESKVSIDSEQIVADKKLSRYHSLWTIQNYLSNPLKVRLAE